MSDGHIVREADEPWQEWTDPAIRAKSPIRWKLLVGGERIASRGLVVGTAELPVGARLIRHHHAPPEAYYFLEGRGQMEVSGEVTEVGPSSAVYIPADASHALFNTGTALLRFVWIFPANRFDEIQYIYDE